MASYRFRVIFEEDTDIYRDIDIQTEQTFLQFHNVLVKAFGFSGMELASFFISDDNWRKGTEITLEDMSDEESHGTGKPLLMHKQVLADFIEDPHQKMIYVFDYLNMFTFMIELIKIIPKDDPKLVYPAITKSVGETPKQFKGKPSIPLLSDEDDDDEDHKAARSAKAAFTGLEQFDEEDDYETEDGEDGEKDEFDELSSGHHDGHEDY